MSIQAMAWVLDHSPAKGTDRLVLLSIANHAAPHQDDTGAFEAYPGIDTIAWECQIDRPRTIKDAVTRLQAAGMVERIVNGAPDGRIPAHRRPNLYRILTRGDGVSAERPPRSEARGVAAAFDGVSPEREMGDAHATPKPSENRAEPEEKETTRATVSLFDPDEERQDGAAFERFWAEYPRNTAKGAARKAWPRAVRNAGGATAIIDGAARFAADPHRDERFTPHASTWLNAERWGDDPLPARGDPRASARQALAGRREGQSRVVSL
jgi:hypothetical protein